MIGANSDVYSGKVPKAVNGETGAGEQGQGETELSDDECAAELVAAAGAGGSTTTIFQ
jgi:hypothetical protein